MKKIKHKLINFFKWIWIQVKDWHNLIILLIVAAIMSSEIWIMYILGFIYNSAILINIGSVCFAFWLGPFTPFWPLCIAITLFIRRFIDKIWRPRHPKDEK